MTSIRHLPLSMLLLLAILAGCGPRQTLTDSEFLAFCHTGGGRKGACDTVGLCREYLATVGQPQKSLEACLQGCEDVRRTLRGGQWAGCAGAAASGNDWCQRYCRTLFP